MSIQSLREELRGLPGAERLVMQYDEGGQAQVFYIDDTAVRLGPTAGADEIRAAFLEAWQPPLAVKKARKKATKKRREKPRQRPKKRR